MPSRARFAISSLTASLRDNPVPSTPGGLCSDQKHFICFMLLFCTLFVAAFSLEKFILPSLVVIDCVYAKHLPLLSETNANMQ